MIDENRLDTGTDRLQERTRGAFALGHLGWWLAAGAVFYFLPQLSRHFTFSFLLLPVVGLPAVIAFFSSVDANLQWQYRRRLLSIVAVPVLVISTVAAALHFQFDSDWLRFQLTRGSYVRLARELPGTGPKYHEWDWDGTGGVPTADVSHWLVYDETDRPLERFNTTEPGGIWSVQPYGSHFFLVTSFSP